MAHEELIDHLRKAQKHLKYAENRLGKAGLGAHYTRLGLESRIWAWTRMTRELQVALYQEGIKLLEKDLDGTQESSNKIERGKP